MPDIDRTAILAGFDALRGTPGIPDTYLDLRRILWSEQVDAHDRYVEGGPAIDAASRLHFILDFLAHLRDRLPAPGGTQTLARMHERMAGDPALLDRWLEAALKADPAHLDQLELGAVIPVADLRFIGRVLLAPLAYAEARAKREDRGVDVSRGGCPACAAEPALSLIETDGHRQLCCSLCGVRWSMERMVCVFCGHRTLEFIADREDTLRWIETCAACERFVKTVDVRQRGSRTPSALIEVTAALTLDLIAEREGLRPAAPYAALV